MDLYRFFHPHYNPRLRNVPVRLQELNEISLAIKEISRVLHRTSRRLGHNIDALNHMESTKEAIELAHNLIESAILTYEEDTQEDLEEMLKERRSAPGWEAWCRLVESRLNYLKNQINSQNTSPGDASDLDDSILSVLTDAPKKTVNE